MCAVMDYLKRVRAYDVARKERKSAKEQHDAKILRRNTAIGIVVVLVASVLWYVNNHVWFNGLIRVLLFLHP